MSRWSDVESLFERLRDLPPEDRRTVLESQGDAETVVEVVSLLSAHDAAEDFLAEPAFAHPEVSEEQWTSDIATCERIGPYRITRVLGAGGMGVVLEARQEHPDRAVALKLLRGGALDRRAPRAVVSPRSRDARAARARRHRPGP